LVISQLSQNINSSSNNYNITKETAELSKCKDLEVEISRIWTVRTKIVPVIIGALETIKKRLDQNLQMLPGQRQPFSYRRPHSRALHI
jgi:hypothetical protein